MPAASHWHQHLEAIARRLCAAEAEVERLKALQRTDAEQLDRQAIDFRAAQDLLLERARQADELMAQVESSRAQSSKNYDGMVRAERERDELVGRIRALDAAHQVLDAMYVEAKERLARAEEERDQARAAALRGQEGRSC